MAKSQKTGGRNGAVRARTQIRDPKAGLWVTRDTDTGRFTEAKRSGGSFKGVRREK